MQSALQRKKQIAFALGQQTEHYREVCRQEGQETLLIGSNEQEAGTILLFLQGFESSSNSPEPNLFNELLTVLQHRH